MFAHMSLPAELCKNDAEGNDPIVLASGPFIIMACGLLSVAADERAAHWVRTPGGDLGCDAVASMMQSWKHPVSTPAERAGHA